MIDYAMLDGKPVRYNHRTEAWWCANDEWRPIPIAEVGVAATVLTEKDFNTFFPDLPPLPPEAFKDG